MDNFQKGKTIKSECNANHRIFLKRKWSPTKTMQEWKLHCHNDDLLWTWLPVTPLFAIFFGFGHSVSDFQTLKNGSAERNMVPAWKYRSNKGLLWRKAGTSVCRFGKWNIFLSKNLCFWFSRNDNLYFNSDARNNC